MEESNVGCSESDSTSTVSSSGSEGTDIINNLPWEVVHEIFGHLDCISLLICKRVCSNWRNHVNHMEKDKLFWYNHCQRDVPSWVQMDLLDHIFPSHWKDRNKVDWEEIYKSWYFWSSLYEAPVTVHKLATDIRGISAIKVSGEWVLITTCELGGKLIGQRLTGSDPPVELYVGGGAILNFELVTTEKRSCSRLRADAQFQEVFNTLGHNEIWLEFNNFYIQIGKSYCHTVDNIRQRIRHSYGYEMRLLEHRNSSSLILKKICAIHGPELMELELSSSYNKILEFWRNTILLSVPTNNVICDAVSVNMRTQEASVKWGLLYNTAGLLYNTYTWQGSLLVVYTNKRSCMIDCNGGHMKKQVIAIKKPQIASVLYYANYFFVGTDRGQLLIYRVKSPEDCTKILFYSTPFWNIEVCQGKITYIAIAEPIHLKRKGPAVICATTEEVYMVSISI